MATPNGSNGKATADVDETKIVYLPNIIPPAPLEQCDYTPFRGTSTPIVIDNGSSTLRYGFARDPTTNKANKDPFCAPNVSSRFKDRKSNRQVLLFGESVELDSGARSQARTPWEGDVLLNFDSFENALDHAFVHLNVDAAESIEHPVIMTERLSSPLHSRALTSELMFELYGTPRLLYCVDSVMSFYQNSLPLTNSQFVSDGLVISFNTASTSVIPVLSGKGILSHCKRIPWGASQASDYLQKLVQLKYPSFPTRITTPQMTWIFQNLCEFSPDYTTLLRQLKDPLQLRAHERIIQFPYAAVVEVEKTEEELAKAAERRRLQGRKLQEIAAAKRAEKLTILEEWHQSLTNIMDFKASMTEEEWKQKLKSENYANEADLQKGIREAEKEIAKRRKRGDGGAEEQEREREEEEPTFPLVDTPDAELDEEGLKEKKRQKLMKAGWEARVRARKEKEREKEEREAEERRDTEDRERDLSAWADKLRKEHEVTMTRIKDRTRRKAAMNDRKSAISQARMKNIANLAADDRVPKRKRKAGGEDMFGADDDDWMIYRKINTEAPSSDEEEDIARLEAVEQKLLAHDPLFQEEHTYAALTSRRSALIQAFRPQYPEGDRAGSARVHLSTERWRACETWFSPSIAGVDCAGIGEVVQNVLTRFSEAEKGRLVNRVFVTGAPSQLPGLTDRLHNTMRPILPPDMPLNIVRADNPTLDAWRGMAACSLDDNNWRYAVTNEEYAEWGGERIRRWWGGNWNSSFVDPALQDS